MKRLYENIENVNVRDIDDLTGIVKIIDYNMQQLTEMTSKVVELLCKYSGSVKGNQFAKLVRESLKLRDDLYDNSLEMNDIQNQIVCYQNKLYSYEDKRSSARQPNPYMITKKPVSFDTSIVKFEKKEMIELNSVLKNYSERVVEFIKKIDDKKNEAGHYWKDRQYKDFSEFISIIKRNVMESIKVFDEYTKYLDEKIRELS